jgi:hypothetical protein
LLRLHAAEAVTAGHDLDGPGHGAPDGVPWACCPLVMNRLTNATAPAPIPNQPAGGSGALAYGYDWVGNRLNPPSGANHMVYNPADRLTSWPGMRQYTYYPDGSLAHVTNAPFPSPFCIHHSALCIPQPRPNHQTIRRSNDQTALRSLPHCPPSRILLLIR